MNTNVLFASKFRGCKQIGELENTNTGQILRIYELPKDGSKEGELVGVNDGSSCWIANRKYSLFNIKPVGSFVVQARPRVRLLTSPAPAQSRQRRKLI